MVTGLTPERESDYRFLHATPWPSVIAKINKCNLRNYSIYRIEIDGKPYLFSYFEYIGKDFDADMARMAADSEIQRWWREVIPCVHPLPKAPKNGPIWTIAEEVFFAA